MMQLDLQQRLPLAALFANHVPVQWQPSPLERQRIISFVQAAAKHQVCPPHNFSRVSFRI
jgi:hypothetical protein